MSSAETIRGLTTARAVFPFNPRFREGLAGFYGATRRPDLRHSAAVAAIRDALRDDPFGPNLHRDLALLLYAEGDKDGAAAELAKLGCDMPQCRPN